MHNSVVLFPTSHSNSLPPSHSLSLFIGGSPPLWRRAVVLSVHLVHCLCLNTLSSSIPLPPSQTLFRPPRCQAWHDHRDTEGMLQRTPCLYHHTVHTHLYHHRHTGIAQSLNCPLLDPKMKSCIQCHRERERQRERERERERGREETTSGDTWRRHEKFFFLCARGSCHKYSCERAAKNCMSATPLALPPAKSPNPRGGKEGRLGAPRAQQQGQGKRSV